MNHPDSRWENGVKILRLPEKNIPNPSDFKPRKKRTPEQNAASSPHLAPAHPETVRSMIQTAHSIQTPIRAAINPAAGI